jgi:hypothetical protein
MIHEWLTNERLTKYFKNNFEMANFAIAIARQMVKSGKELILEDLIEEIVRAKEAERLVKTA